MGCIGRDLTNSGSGVGSDTPVAQGGTLNPDTCMIEGAPAPVIEISPERRDPSRFVPAPPPPPEYLPEMKGSDHKKHNSCTFAQDGCSARSNWDRQIHCVPTCYHTLGRASEGFEARIDSLCSAKTNPGSTIV